MKKLLLTCVVALCALAVAQAQPGRTMFGIKGGLNFPNMKNLGVESMALTSAHAGIFHNIRFGEKSPVRFQTELLYSRQGADLRDNQQEIKLDYLALPLALQLALNPTHRAFSVAVYLEGGVQLGHLLSGKVEREGQETVSLQDHYAGGEVKNTDVAALAGIGLQLGYSYQINWRYVYGLTPVVQSSAGGDGISNKMFQMSMAIAF